MTIEDSFIDYSSVNDTSNGKKKYHMTVQVYVRRRIFFYLKRTRVEKTRGDRNGCYVSVLRPLIIQICLSQLKTLPNSLKL